MNKVENLKSIRSIFELLEKAIKENFKYKGKREWGNPSGDHQELDVYQIEDGVNKVWLSTIEWCNASSDEVNRCGVITTVPDYNKRNTLGQIFEMNLPYYFSKSFNTRVYEEGNSIEIRNYGKFTIGRRGLKKQYFFDYLRENGYGDDIENDEEGKEYIIVIILKNGNIDLQLIKSRLIKWTILLKEFKDYYRKLLTH